MSEQYLSQDEIDALLDESEGGAANASDDAANADEGTGVTADDASESVSADSEAGEQLAVDGSDGPAHASSADDDHGTKAAPSMPPVGHDPAPGEPQPYDLTRQERIVLGRMPALELIHERFARSFGLAMFGFMRRNPEIGHDTPVVGRYADFVRQIKAPSSINIMQTRPLSGSALLVLDGALVSTVVDLMFGGTGRPTRQNEGREFSITEQRLIKKIIELCRTEYARAWEGIHPFEMVFNRSETQPQFANIAIPTEMVVSTTFTLQFNDQSGSIHVCIPYTVLEPIRDILCSPLHTQGAPSERNWVEQMSKEIRPANVELVAQLTTATLTLGDLMNLRQGDVIEIEPGPDAVLKIGQVPIFSGRYGEHNGRYAVRIDTVHSYTDIQQG
ncbi:MAG: flagellar motor switch protein FliM [Lautropia sp.]|nr:flagellar motor switch protein FliM [Lautropia sp.]